MTHDEALHEARLRWGINGHAFYFKKRSGLPKGADYCVGCGYRAIGEGETWEDAFADADRKEK